MEYRQVCNSRLEISAIGLGCTNFGTRATDEQAAVIVHAAIDSGITLIDTANSYSAGKSEEAVGKALRHRRDQVILTSKFAQPMGEGPMNCGGSRHHIMRAVEDSIGSSRFEAWQLVEAVASTAQTAPGSAAISLVQVT